MSISSSKISNAADELGRSRFWHDDISGIVSSNLRSLSFLEGESVQRRISGMENDSTFDLKSEIKDDLGLLEGYFEPPEVPEKEILLSKKIRFYPTAEQSKLFLKCVKGHNYIYNRSVKDFQKHNEMNYMRIIRRVVAKDGDLSKRAKWLKDVPYATRQQAVKTFADGLKVARASGKQFEMGFRSRKTHDDYFVVRNNAVKVRLQKLGDGKISTRLTIFAKRFGNYLEAMTLRISKRSERWIQSSGGAFDNKLNLTHCASISHRKDGAWYLIIHHKRHDRHWDLSSKPVPPNFKNDSIVALDPGVRTFQTFYSENTHGKIGDNFISKRLSKLNNRIDRLTSRISTAKGRTKYNMRKRCNRVYKKVSNIVLDLHRKAASFLVNKYDTILIPNFQTKQMSSKRYRNISRPTSRGMYQLGHYAFRERLVDVSNRDNVKSLSSGWSPRSRVVVCSEAYTTKTCGKCGVINPKVGSAKVFKCRDKKCGFVLDRDVNGARNILIRFLTRLFEDSPIA